MAPHAESGSRKSKQGEHAQERMWKHRTLELEREKRKKRRKRGVEEKEKNVAVTREWSSKNTGEILVAPIRDDLCISRTAVKARSLLIMDFLLHTFSNSGRIDQFWVLATRWLQLAVQSRSFLFGPIEV